MPSRLLACCLSLPVLLVLVLRAAPVQAADTMVWTLPDFAPASLPVNGQPGQGLADKMALYFQTHWPEMEHRFVTANVKRVWTDIAAGGQACHLAALVTSERRQLAYFTLTHLAPPPMLIVRAETLAALPVNQEGDVNLSRLFAMRTLHGVVVEKRSFGEAIDGVIAERGATGIRAVPPAHIAGSLLKMLAAGQLDYTIEYDLALSYQQRQNSALKGLRAVAIEGITTMEPVGIACPRTHWGKARIERIDSLLASKEGAAAMRQAADSWATPGMLQRYHKELDAFTAKRAQPTNPGAF